MVVGGRFAAVARECLPVARDEYRSDRIGLVGRRALQGQADRLKEPGPIGRLPPQGVVRDGHVAHPSYVQYGHAAVLVERKPRSGCHPRGRRLSDEERGYGDAQVIDPVFCQKQGQHPASSLDKEPSDSLRAELADQVSCRQAVAFRTDDGRHAAQCRGTLLRRAVADENDFFSVAFREKAGGRVQIGITAQRDLDRIGRQSPFGPELAQSFVAGDQGRIVATDGFRADQNRVAFGAETTDFLPVGRVRQDEPTVREVVYVTVDADGYGSLNDHISDSFFDRQSTLDFSIYANIATFAR